MTEPSMIINPREIVESIEPDLNLSCDTILNEISITLDSQNISSEHTSTDPLVELMDSVNIVHPVVTQDNTLDSLATTDDINFFIGV